jgi:hypothetical protein
VYHKLRKTIPAASFLAQLRALRSFLILVTDDRDAVEEVAWSNLSMMSEWLLDTFTDEEVLDLFAFLKAPMHGPVSSPRPGS